MFTHNLIMKISATLKGSRYVPVYVTVKTIMGVP